MRRDRFEMKMAVLEAVRSGKEKLTHIQRGAALNHKATKEILAELVERGLVELTIRTATPYGMRYSPTEKGLEAMAFHERLRKIM